MDRDHHLLYTYAVSLIFALFMTYACIGAGDEPSHIPRWLIGLLAILYFATFTYFRERHHARRRAVWHAHLTPPPTTETT